MSIRDRASHGVSAKRKKKTPPVRRAKLKDTIVPDGFVLKIDTREQHPLFIHDIIRYGNINFVIQKLDHGDYSYVGGENIIAIERKYKNDFYKYILDHTKTVEKIRRMDEDGVKFKALVIEASEDDLYDLSDSFSPYITIEMVRGFMISMGLKYNMHIYCNRDREDCERWVMDRLVKMYEISEMNKINKKEIEDNGNK